MYQKSIPLVLLLVQKVLSLPATNEYSDVTNNGVVGVSDATNNGAYGSTNANIGGNIVPPAQNAVNPQNAVGNGPSPNGPANPPGPAYESGISSVGTQEVITSTIVVTWTTNRALKPTVAPNGIPIDPGNFIAANTDQRGPVQAPGALNGPSAGVSGAAYLPSYSSMPGSVSGGAYAVASSSNVVDTSYQSTAPVIPAGNGHDSSNTPTSVQVAPVPERSSNALFTTDPAPQPVQSTSPPDATPSSEGTDESPDTTTDDDMIPPITRAPRLPTFSEAPPRFSTMRIESMAHKNGLLRTALNGIQTILPVIDGLGLLGIESEGTYLNLPGLLDAIDIPCLFRCNTPPAPTSPQPGAVPQAPAAAPPVAAPAVAGAPAAAAPVAGGGVGAVGAGAPAAAGMAAGGAEAVGGAAGAGAAAGGAGAIGGIVGAGAGAVAGGFAGGAAAVGGIVGGGAPAAANAVAGGADAVGGAAGNAPVEAAQVPAPEVGAGAANNPLLGSPGRSLVKGVQSGIENGLDQSGGSPQSNNLPSQSLDGHANDAVNNVGPQPGSDSIQNAPVNGMDSGNANDMIYPVAASSSPPPEPIQSGLTSGTENNMYQPAAPMSVNSAQAYSVQDGVQRGTNDNMAAAGGLTQPNQELTGSVQYGVHNGYGNNMAPPAGSIVPNYPPAAPPQNGAYMGMHNNMNNANANIQPTNNMGQSMPPAGATMNSFLGGAQGPPAAGQMIQPNVVAGGPMVVPGQVNYPSSSSLINAGPIPIYAGSSSRPLFPVMITPGPSLTPMGTPTPTPAAASSSVPPPVTTTQSNGEVVSCASGKYFDDDHDATPECAGATKVISTVESIASSYSAEASASTSRMAEFVSYMGVVHASAAASKIAGINGWTDGQSFSDALRKKCHKNGFFVNFKINDYLFYKHEKSQFEGRERDTEKVTFTMSGFKNGCVEAAILDAGGPRHICDHKKEDKLPPKNMKEAKDAGENVDDLLMIPVKE
ncbi:hypothetical protein ABOM_007748 [Aspergillus bombycis]|uniref:Uncharacterized protein n=1 Tax=Aspergillus bombycis TaxID=109264 RepID=A0A1F7ZXM9_9EURO|nr:hypothetical protein ABOM_007748 [Aspergillus bombycis]OGM44233.1 hypothetical protein ABOM_007748 [Aspergillus bombycis]